MEIVPLISTHENTSAASFSGACTSLIHMPLDIFVEICNHLPPYDLHTLTYVCRQFHYWLNSTTSYITRDIWNYSRLNLDEHMKLDPPEGMDEITFIKLSLIEKKCQICKNDQEIPKIYWVFRVRLCTKCFRTRVTIADTIPVWPRDAIDLSLILPYEYLVTSRNIKKCVYWNSELISTLQECLLIPDKEIGDWIFHKQTITNKKIEDSLKRTKNDENRINWLLKKKKDYLDQIVKTLESIRDDTGKKIYIKKHILSQPIYKKAHSTLNTPFMDTGPWPNLLEKLKNEYYENIIIKQRRKSIIYRIIKLLTYRKLSNTKGEIFINDPILDYLEWCPTFIKPPVKLNDVDDVIRRIRVEARDYLKKKLYRRRVSFLTIEGCIKLLTQCKTCAPLFKCKLCWGSRRKSYNSYDEVNRHLACQGTHNLYYSDINDSLIEVDHENVKKLISIWLSKIVLKKTT
ncbi:unnamed protein product [Rhizophagus irregularis]|nr:unnamed protein product [Rhizophagus irregularis]CAB5384487.1 unnamed protein product [Rhizophagus irregularis]